MDIEQGKQPLPEGERYLQLLGLGHLADQEIKTAKGTLLGRDFLDICGDKALPLLIGFEHMSPDDPRYQKTKDALVGYISRYVEGRTE